MNTRIVLRLLWRLRQLRQRDLWTRPQLEMHQAQALEFLRAYTYAHSPFYQRFHKGAHHLPLEALPVLTKATLMEEFDEVVTDRALRLAEVQAHLSSLAGDAPFLGRYRVNATSGSTGRRGLFLFNEEEWITILASFARGHDWAGARINLAHRMKMASVASTAPWHMSARVGATLASRWMPALRLDASEPVDTIVQQLNAWQPDMLIVYASMARLLADEQRAGRLHVDPALLFTSSEVLTEETRRRVEEAWGRLPFNEYGATECGLIAAECNQHVGLHLAEDLVLIEVVDERNRPVPAGEYGDKLLLTVLFNYTQPLIRYEISDRVKLSPEPPPTHRPYRIIAEIEGRAEDILHLPTLTGGQASVHPVLFHQLLDGVPATGWQVVLYPDRLEVLLGGVEHLSDDNLPASLACALAARGIVAPPIQVRRVATLSRNAAGKAPLIRTAIDVLPRPQQTATAARSIT